MITWLRRWKSQAEDRPRRVPTSSSGEPHKTKTRESRALLKERFDYSIFMYEAEKVGITATGEMDANELYPNDKRPAQSFLSADQLDEVPEQDFKLPAHGRFLIGGVPQDCRWIHPRRLGKPGFVCL
jgi:hypothetical protein